MSKKKKPTKDQRREARLRKGAQWLTTYQGTPPFSESAPTFSFKNTKYITWYSSSAQMLSL